MAVAEQREREKAQKSTLSLHQNLNKRIREEVRENILKENQGANQDDDTASESWKRRAFALGKKYTTKKLDKELGGLFLAAIVGFFSGGTLALAARWVGRYFGITGIITFIILSLIFSLLVFIAVLKGYCDTYVGSLTDYFTTNICPSLK